MTSFINLWNGVITAELSMREQILRVEYEVDGFLVDAELLEGERHEPGPRFRE